MRLLRTSIPLLTATVVAAVLAGCVALPADPYYSGDYYPSPAPYPGYGAVTIYEQPGVIYHTAPPPPPRWRHSPRHEPEYRRDPPRRYEHQRPQARPPERPHERPFQRPPERPPERPFQRPPEHSHDRPTAQQPPQPPQRPDWQAPPQVPQATPPEPRRRGVIPRAPGQGPEYLQR